MVDLSLRDSATPNRGNLFLFFVDCFGESVIRPRNDEVKEDSTFCKSQTKQKLYQGFANLFRHCE